MSQLNIAQVAEAAKVALNAGTFSPAFTAKRVYTPYTDPESLGNALRVFVFAKEDGLQTDSRSTTRDELSIDIAVMKKITGDPTAETANTEIDALSAVAKSIAMFFKPGLPLGATGAVSLRVLIPLAYDTQRLLTEKIFQCIITVTFYARVTPG